MSSNFVSHSIAVQESVTRKVAKFIRFDYHLSKEIETNINLWVCKPYPKVYRHYIFVKLSEANEFISEKLRQ